MSISKYETLAKVVELGSLTRAADALGCTQSAVSHTINNLEAELGVLWPSCAAHFQWLTAWHYRPQ